MAISYNTSKIISDKNKKILNDVILGKSRVSPLQELKINNVVIPVPFDMTINGKKVISKSVIIDGGEVFERISTRSSNIELSGKIIVDTKLSNAYLSNANDEENNAAEFVNKITIFKDSIIKPNEVLVIVNPILNTLGIDSVILEDHKIKPIIGACGFEWSLSCIEAHAVKSKLGDTLIIT